VARFSLSDAQLVVAREYGFESWPKLKHHVESVAHGHASAANPTSTSPTVESHAVRVARFLEYACPDHHVRGGVAHIMARNAAVRMLKQHPQIARDSFYTAVVCGELEEVERILSRKPELPSEKYSATGPERAGVGGSEDLFKDLGPKRWEPLLYLCCTSQPDSRGSPPGYGT